MDKNKRTLLKSTAALALLPVAQLQAKVLNTNSLSPDSTHHHTLSFTITPEGIEVKGTDIERGETKAVDIAGTAKVKSDSMVSFSNHTAETIYLSPRDNPACPFSEGWPSSIGPGQCVKRLLTTKTSGLFSFGYYPLAYAGKGESQGIQQQTLGQKLRSHLQHPSSQFQIV